MIFCSAELVRPPPCSSSSRAPQLHLLSERLKGARGLVFTTLTREQLTEVFEGYGEATYARAGARATETVEIPSGPLEGPTGPIVHTLEPALRALGMPTKLNKGVVELLSDHTICREGQKLTAQQCQLLKVPVGAALPLGGALFPTCAFLKRYRCWTAVCFFPSLTLSPSPSSPCPASPAALRLPACAVGPRPGGRVGQRQLRAAAGRRRGRGGGGRRGRGGGRRGGGRHPGDGRRLGAHRHLIERSRSRYNSALVLNTTNVLHKTHVPAESLASSAQAVSYQLINFKRRS